MAGGSFLRWSTIEILILGPVAFALSTACGVLQGKLMLRLKQAPVCDRILPRTRRPAA